MSAGTVLMAWMIRHLVEEERVNALDFGLGDDPYKQSWVTARRQRIGVMLVNPQRPRGLAVLGRAVAGLS
jgi:CelD/BcsL family acetyltransferase involved in cellulose biosynthesis